MMDATRFPGAEENEVRLDQVVLYLFSRESMDRGGIRISLSDVHRVLEPLSDDLEEELGLRTKWHRNEYQVHSRQVEGAMHDLVPYSLSLDPVNADFYMHEDQGEVAYRHLEERLPPEIIDTLERIADNPAYQEAMKEYSF